MRLAVLADIHGNLPALEAVLADLQQHDVDGIIIAGDLTGGGPYPVETIRLLRTLSCWIIRGNTKISDVNGALHTNLPVESNTIGGYIVNLMGAIPDTGTGIEIEGDFRITVLKSDKQKIELLEFIKHVR